MNDDTYENEDRIPDFLDLPTAVERKKSLHIWYIWLMPILLYFVISLICLFALRKQVGMLDTDGFLFLCFLKAPFQALSTYPPFLWEMAVWLFAQSIVFGLFVSLVMAKDFKAALAIGDTGYAHPWFALFIKSAVTIVLGWVIVWIFFGFVSLAGRNIFVTSERCKTLPQKVAVLKHSIIDVPGQVEATEFRQSLGETFLFSTYWRAFVALKVPPKEIERWTHMLKDRKFQPLPADATRPSLHLDSKSLAERSSVDIEGIDTRRSEWEFVNEPAWQHHTTAPEYFKYASSSFAIVYPKEGILFVYLDLSR